MACIDLDFDHSKKFLVFLACANPKVFRYYVKLDPASISPFPPALPAGQHVAFPPSPEYLGFYDYGYGEYYDDEMMMSPPPSTPEQGYGHMVQPTVMSYVRFTPPTSRFPGGPPQLRRTYPPPRPPRPPSPVIVDASHPADPFFADQQAAAAQAANGEEHLAGNGSPIVKDVTPPPGQQTSPPQGNVSTKAKTRSHASKSHRSREKKAATKGKKLPSRRDKTTNAAPSKKTPSRSSKLSRSRHSESRTKTRSTPTSSGSPSSKAASSDFYLVDSDGTGSTSCHASMFLPKLRARLHAALRRIHPAEATSSVRNLSHYSASVTGLV